MIEGSQKIHRREIKTREEEEEEEEEPCRVLGCKISIADILELSTIVARWRGSLGTMGSDLAANFIHRTTGNTPTM